MGKSIKVRINELSLNRSHKPKTEIMIFNILPEHNNLGDCIHIIVMNYLERLEGVKANDTQHVIMSKDWSKQLRKWRSDKMTFNVRCFHHSTKTYTAIQFKQESVET